MNAMVVSFLLLALLSAHLHPGRSQQGFHLMNFLCNNGSSYALNSTYHSNVVALLGSLSADASNSTVGFATGAAGRGPDQVWGLALCRGDVNGTSCASCLALALAPGVALDNCRGVRDVSVYYDRCLLRYSSEDFLASPDDPGAPMQYSPNRDVNITGCRPCSMAPPARRSTWCGATLGTRCSPSTTAARWRGSSRRRRVVRRAGTTVS